MTIVDTSIIIPARNAESTIASCLASIASLDPGPLEVIVVDDASVDATSALAAQSGARVIRLGENAGPGLARNAGARVARGGTLAFTDADCRVPKDWLARFHAEPLARRYSGITGPYAGAIAPTALATLMDRALKHEQRHLPAAIESSISSNLFVRAADFRAVGGFPAYRLAGARMCCFGNEDEELAHLLVEHTGLPVRWLPENGVEHAFRATWRGYAAQQSRYAEAILVSYARFPKMARRPTNYSRGGGVKKLLAFWCAASACAAAPALGPAALVGCAPFLLVNAGSVRRLLRDEPSAVGAWRLALLAYPFHAVTALAWTGGLLGGAAKCAFAGLSLGFRPGVAA